MKKKNKVFKRILSLSVSSSMILGTCLTAYAGETYDTETVENIEDEENIMEYDIGEDEEMMETVDSETETDDAEAETDGSESKDGDAKAEETVEESETAFLSVCGGDTEDEEVSEDEEDSDEEAESDEEDDDIILTAYEINPLYADVITEDDLLVGDDVDGGIKTLEKEDDDNLNDDEDVSDLDNDSEDTSDGENETIEVIEISDSDDSDGTDGLIEIIDDESGIQIYGEDDGYDYGYDEIIIDDDGSYIEIDDAELIDDDSLSTVEASRTADNGYMQIILLCTVAAVMAGIGITIRRRQVAK